jgi:hypothetical protein
MKEIQYKDNNHIWNKKIIPHKFFRFMGNYARYGKEIFLKLQAAQLIWCQFKFSFII